MSDDTAAALQIQHTMSNLGLWLVPIQSKRPHHCCSVSAHPALSFLLLLWVQEVSAVQESYVVRQASEVQQGSGVRSLAQWVLQDIQWNGNRQGWLR